MARFAIQCDRGMVEIEGDFGLPSLTKAAIEAVGSLPEADAAKPKGFGFQIEGAGESLITELAEDEDD